MSYDKQQIKNYLSLLLLLNTVPEVHCALNEMDKRNDLLCCTRELAKERWQLRNTMDTVRGSKYDRWMGVVDGVAKRLFPYTIDGFPAYSTRELCWMLHGVYDGGGSSRPKSELSADTHKMLGYIVDFCERYFLVDDYCYVSRDPYTGWFSLQTWKRRDWRMPSLRSLDIDPPFASFELRYAFAEYLQAEKKWEGVHTMLQRIDADERLHAVVLDQQLLWATFAILSLSVLSMLFTLVRTDEDMKTAMLFLSSVLQMSFLSLCVKLFIVLGGFDRL